MVIVPPLPVYLTALETRLSTTCTAGPFLVAKSSIALTQASAPRSYEYDGSIWFEWVFRYAGPVVSDGSAQNPVITARLHGPFARGEDATCSAETVYAPQTKTLQVTQSGEELHVHMRIPAPG